MTLATSGLGLRHFRGMLCIKQEKKRTKTQPKYKLLETAKLLPRFNRQPTGDNDATSSKISGSYELFQV
jgi:hypothetical protein